ncbi:sensor domain-containing protein [Mycolicibacterium alvei]|uniref:PknH-like extracellular domain-containing protein n=1 Tax=Mycolicibacterium alvei TaxID=67081 RepID=A0A6N4V239_9MYCO|nr:sensor domain-containing protein [Mycolicibacterium alvei]MCV7003427.1 sensor domain-containing protein [Mycolicibacterium alvei]BBX30628.1 hypothetical protein MALV_57530 [Mycolicibacterium alvei]
MSKHDGDNQPEDMTVDWPARQREQTPPTASPDEERTTVLRNTPPPPAGGYSSPTPPPPPPSTGYAPPTAPAGGYGSPASGYTPLPPAPGTPTVAAPAAPWQSPPPPATPGQGWPPAGPGGGYPPAPPTGGYPGAPEPSGPRRGGIPKLGIALGAVAAIAILAIGTVAFLRINDGESTPSDTTTTAAAATTTPAGEQSPTSSQTTSPTDTPAPTGGAGAGGLVDPANLSKLLLTADVVSTRMSSPGMTPGDLSTKPVSGVSVDPPGCTGVFTPAHTMVYGGEAGFAAQAVFDPNKGPHTVIQAVASFETAELARQFFDRQADDWAKCKFTTLTISSPESSDTNTVKTSAVNNDESDPDAPMLQTLMIQDAPKKMCGRNMTVRANVVIDVRACSDNPGSAAFTMVRDIGEKITGKR